MSHFLCSHSISRPSCIHSLSQSYRVNGDLQFDLGLTTALEERERNRRKERKWWLFGFTTKRLERTAMNSPTATPFFLPGEANGVPWRKSPETHPGILNWGDLLNQRSSRNSTQIYIDSMIDCKYAILYTSTGSVITRITFQIFRWRYSNSVGKYPPFPTAIAVSVCIKHIFHSKEHTAIWLQPVALHLSSNLCRRVWWYKDESLVTQSGCRAFGTALWHLQAPVSFSKPVFKNGPMGTSIGSGLRIFLTISWWFCKPSSDLFS